MTKVEAFEAQRWPMMPFSASVIPCALRRERKRNDAAQTQDAPFADAQPHGRRCNCRA
jgi:hypothetical protein